MPNRLAALALLTGASVAMAASSTRAGDWDGFSLSVGGGYGMTNNQFGISATDGSASASEKINDVGINGGFVTVGAGYDRSFFNTLVVGAFIDYDFSNLNTNLPASALLFADTVATASFEIDNQLSIGGRFGYLVSPMTLFFTSFGYARVDTSDLKASGTSNFGPISGTLGRLETFNGYFIGGGVETLLSHGFSIKAEYRYTSLQAENTTLEPGFDPGADTASIKPHIQTAKLALNYRFSDGKSELLKNSTLPVISNWTGAYIGTGSGYSIAKSQITFTDITGGPDPIIDNGSSYGYDGGFISFTAGYDYQFRPRFVIGAFADADLSNLNFADSLSLSDNGTTISESVRSDFKNILMVGGRLGFLATPDTLLFVSAGYANSGLDDTRITARIDGGGLTDPIGTVLFDGKRFSGVFVGGGVETRINDALSLKAEYRYLDLGSEQMTLLPNDAPEINEFISTKFDPVIQMGRLSINYRFGGRDEPAAPLK